MSIFLFLVALALLLWVEHRRDALRRDFEREKAANERRLAELAARIWELEQGRAAEPARVPGPAVPSVEVNAPPLPEPAPVVPAPVFPAPVFPAPAPEPVPGPAAPKRQRRSRDDWEAVVGANWFNRAGILILVIGIALLLGYSLTRLGPAGKVGVGLGVGLSLLGIGVALERTPLYRNFAYGLIAGGWASTYFTVYAMHGVPEAKVIGSPVLGMLLLIAVSTGMILHSFRYRSEIVTGLAYVTAFIALQISPVSQFSLAATIPLAASLLFVAQRYRWMAMAATGLVLTYAVFALQYRPAIEMLPVLSGAPLVWTYWLLFESFDILLESRGAGGLRWSLFPLNAFGLVGASVLTWAPLDSASLHWFLLAASMAYAGSALLRARWTPEADRTSAPLGAYEPAVTVSALLMMWSIFRRFQGTRIDLGLLLEGEFLTLAVLVLRKNFFRWLGAGVLAAALLRILLVDLSAGEYSVAFGRTVHAWTPVALLFALVLAANRWLFPAGRYYTDAAVALTAVAIGAEFRPEWIGLGWLVLSGSLYVLHLPESSSEALVLAILSSAALVWNNVFGPHTLAARVSLGVAAVLYRLAGGRWAAVVSAAFATAFLWHILPAGFVALAWALLGLGLLLEGRNPESAIVLAAFAFLRAWFYNFYMRESLLGLPPRLTTALLVAAIFYVEQWRAREPRERTWFSLLGTGMLLLLLFEDVSGKMLTLALGLQGIALVTAGFIARERILRLSGLALFLYCVLKLFVYDLRQLDTFSRILSFIGLGLLLVAVSWAYTRFRNQIRRYL